METIDPLIFHEFTGSLTFEYLSLKGFVLMSFKDNNSPQQGMRSPEWIVVSWILMAATPVGASSNTLDLLGSFPWYDSNLLTDW